LQDVLFKPFEIEKLVDLIDRRLPPINTE